MWELLQDCWKSVQVKLVDRMARVCKAVIKAKGVYLKNFKYKIYFDLFSTFLFMCNFIVLLSLLLFYNVEGAKGK